MASEAWHDLGPASGSCTICETAGRLSLAELRSRLTLSERLRGEPAAPPSRQVICQVCGWRWSVRHEDPPVASRTVLPAPRASRSSRDWMYHRS